MRRYRIIITSLLLWLAALTAMAQENISQQGCRRGTPRPENTHLRRAGNINKTPGGDFYHGDRHQLTVLVAYNDRPFLGDEAATLEQWNKIFNVERYAEEPFEGSVHDYFKDQSYGKFNLTFDLVYVQVSGNAAKYASDFTDENSQYLVQDIMEVLKSRNDIDWSLYDWNGNGYINQLLIIFAGQGMNDYNSSQYPSTIWPHQWWMSEHLKDRQQGVYCEPIPVSYNDKDYLVDSYCAVAELTKRNDYGVFGTICHEYTHCFGIPDFYYYGNETVEYWDLMDTGNLNDEGFTPPCFSAHERWLMGWLTPIELNETTTITDMPALAKQGTAYLIRNNGCENEYYIVENRQPIGWDSSLPGSGIVIFHIDYDPSIWTSLKVYTNTADLKRYDIFHANDSKVPSSQWAYPFEANDSLTNTSTPAATLNNNNLDGTKLMSKPITNMAVTNGLASFNLTVTPTAPTGMREVRTGADKLLYRFGMIDIIRDAKGNAQKIIRK